MCRFYDGLSYRGRAYYFTWFSLNFVKFLIHNNEPNYVWYNTWNAFKNGNSTDSENALVTIKNRLAGQDGLIPKMINASEFQLM